ncbi:hypothetical protein PMAYCL1PPCAC_28026, partial [Pristionchus mayeri]
QIQEVFNFSIAILPSIIMHSLSIVPALLRANQYSIVTHEMSWFAYFATQSMNCTFTKLALIACHKRLRKRFQRIFISTPRQVSLTRNIETMAPASAYFFLSIETLVNSLSLLIMFPCLGTLLKTQGMHPNCKVLLVTSGFIQLSLLLVQMALFIHDYIIENLNHNASEEKVFTMIQNTFFIMCSFLSLALVLESVYANYWSKQF